MLHNRMADRIPRSVRHSSSVPNERPLRMRDQKAGVRQVRCCDLFPLEAESFCLRYVRSAAIKDVQPDRLWKTCGVWRSGLSLSSNATANDGIDDQSGHRPATDCANEGHAAPQVRSAQEYTPPGKVTS
jgi:hypothetical protein